MSFASSAALAAQAAAGWGGHRAGGGKQGLGRPPPGPTLCPGEALWWPDCGLAIPASPSLRGAPRCPSPGCPQHAPQRRPLAAALGVQAVGRVGRRG